MAGQTTNLIVEAEGTGLVYQWFQGARPDTSRPVGVNSPMLTTPTLNASTPFWVRISNTCGQKDSDDAVVSLLTSCMPPSVIAQPKGLMIGKGQSASLSVMAAGSGPMKIQWFTGTSGNTTNPVAGATASTLTVQNLTATTSFWAQIRNTCGSANSGTATVVVGRSRAARR